MIRAIALSCLTTAVLVAAAPAYAQEDRRGFGINADMIEARIGAAFYDTGPLTNFEFQDFVLNGELLLPSPGFLSAVGSPRPYVGFDVTTADNPINFFYAGLNWDYNLTDRFYLSGSLGGAVNTADNLTNSPNTRSLGTRGTFHLGGAVGYDFTPRLTGQLYWNHFSNGYLSRPNDGHDSLGLRFGARF